MREGENKKPHPQPLPEREGSNHFQGVFKQEMLPTGYADWNHERWVKRLVRHEGLPTGHADGGGGKHFQE
jgi:hypothetical protein